MLLISRNAWNQTSSNTLSSFFQDFEKEELAQVYCRDELPDNKLCKNYFKISERQLVNSIFRKYFYAGERVFIEDIKKNPAEIVHAKTEKRLYDFLRNNRFTLLLWLRELLWKLGSWRSPQLKKFITDFNPDVIYTDAYDTFYTYDLLNYVRDQLNVPFVVFHCDDQVTYNQYSFSPLFWINRWLLRKKVTYAINKAAINYCIIDKQKEVYEQIYKKEFKILNKCADFSFEHTSLPTSNPIKINYAGNIFYGRWKTLAKLAKSIEQVNKGGQKFILEIYTSNPVSKKVLRKLEITGSSILKGYLLYDELRVVQKQSDILLHVESLQLREKLMTSLSFSTKLVDYFEVGRCILAIGWEHAASIEYLKKHNAAITVTDPNTLVDVLQKLSDDVTMIATYAGNAYACGRNYHEKANQLASYREDLIGLKNKKS